MLEGVCAPLRSSVLVLNLLRGFIQHEKTSTPMSMASPNHAPFCAPNRLIVYRSREMMMARIRNAHFCAPSSSTSSSSSRWIFAYDSPPAILQPRRAASRGGIVSCSRSLFVSYEERSLAIS